MLFQRILVPFDGSPTSNLALLRALQIAGDSGAALKIVHVVDALEYLTGFEASSEVLELIRRQAAAVVNQALDITRAAETEAESEVIDKPGSPLGEVVADAARDWRADLVVIGTHGRRGVRRLLLGSGAEQIIRLAPCATLVVRDVDAGART